MTYRLEDHVYNGSPIDRSGGGGGGAKAGCGGLLMLGIVGLAFMQYNKQSARSDHDQADNFTPASNYVSPEERLARWESGQSGSVPNYEVPQTQYTAPVPVAEPVAEAPTYTYQQPETYVQQPQAQRLDYSPPMKSDDYQAHLQSIGNRIDYFANNYIQPSHDNLRGWKTNCLHEAIQLINNNINSGQMNSEQVQLLDQVRLGFINEYNSRPSEDREPPRYQSYGR